MSTSTAFFLSESSLPPTPSPSLNLLPFSLGPNSSPYSSTSIAISSYFIPRPCPPDHPLLKESTPIAAFRGRQLVGQTIDVPKGYRGVMLRSGKRPDRGGVEERRGDTKDVKWPITPASSTASVSRSSVPTTRSKTETNAGEGEEGGVRRSPRKTIKGVGQIALSRPRMRSIPKRSDIKKRIRLDSDDDEETLSQVKRRITVRTPMKRTRSKGLPLTPETPVPDPSLPVIKVQAPTPLKNRPVDVASMDDQLPSSDAENVDAVKQEDIVPSPSTENDPPTFPVPSPGPSSASAEVKSEPSFVDSDSSNDDGAVRVLHPTSMFDHITLWTADAPLAGFRADEDQSAADNKTGGNGETGDDDEGTKIRKSWWRTGGAGEGGDEFVRGMGEWLGLVEMVRYFIPMFINR